MKISVIIPVYNEEKNIPQLYEELVKAGLREKEIIFVDDGSTDGSRAVIRELANKDKSVALISLNKNYGQTLALAAGIKLSTGPVIVTMDADLQNDPADIPRLTALIGDEYDVVSGWRKERKDPALSKIIPSRIANFLISLITGVRLHDFGCTLKAYKREYVDHLSIHGEMHRFLPAYCSWQGAKITELAVNHRPRVHGESKYGINRTFKVILDLMVVKFVLSYLSKPIYVFGGIALLAFLAGTVVNIFVAARRVFEQGEWLSPLFFVGILLWSVSVICFLMGILAEIIVRLYYETRQYDVYRIREKVNI
jgi:glycosyltransferase involved in cell wall biosynthesis